MKLYRFQPSPHGSRVRCALRCKGLGSDVAPPPDVDRQRASFLAPSPMEAPTIVADDGAAMSGSATILDDLQDARQEPSLLPKTPEARDRVRMLVQTAGTYIQNAPRKLFGMADPKLPSRGMSEHMIQHVSIMAVDYRHGIFAGTNDVVERIGGAPGATVESFVRDHRAVLGR